MLESIQSLLSHDMQENLVRQAQADHADLFHQQVVEDQLAAEAKSRVQDQTDASVVQSHGIVETALDLSHMRHKQQPFEQAILQVKDRADWVFRVILNSNPQPNGLGSRGPIFTPQATQFAVRQVEELVRAAA